MNNPHRIAEQVAIEHVDELQFCDDEIRAAFLGKAYIAGTALMAQAVKELRELNDNLKRLTPTGL